MEEVTFGSLADQINTQANVRPTFIDAVRLTALPDNAVVTSVETDPGATVSAGDALIAINGRPIFVLPGAFRFYRDLVPQATGPDVEQLQAGLAAAGHPVPERESGTFGADTERAVAELYETAGYEPVTVAADSLPQPGAPSSPTPMSRIIVPLTEVAVAPRLPATVAELPAVGDTPAGDGGGESEAGGGALLTLHSGPLTVVAEVPSSVVVRVEVGMAVELSSGDGQSATGNVDSLRQPAAEGGEGGTAEGGEGQHELVIAPSTPLPASWADQEVLARIVVNVVSDGALIVPTRAVTSASDGATSVFRLRGDGGFDRVEVRELGTLEGRSAVVPVQNGTLADGDRVRVG
ncbi:MAG: peptidoglycan-binding protein [Acidimicrobiales bacterium]